MKAVTVTVRQFKRNPGLFSPVVFAEWECLSCQTEIILFGAPRIATNAARGHALFCLVTDRGANQFDHVAYGAHRKYMKSQSC